MVSGIETARGETTDAGLRGHRLNHAKSTQKVSRPESSECDDRSGPDRWQGFAGLVTRAKKGVAVIAQEPEIKSRTRAINWKLVALPSGVAGSKSEAESNAFSSTSFQAI